MLSAMTLDELLADSVADVPFHRQVMITLKQNQFSSKKSSLFDVNKVTEVFACARNRHMNANIQSRLDISAHLSASIVHFYFICHRLLDLQQVDCRASITFIPSSLPFYSSPDKKNIVFNSVPGCPPQQQNPLLNKIRSELEAACENGLLLSLKFNEKKRIVTEGNVPTKKGPTIHLGFTSSNAHDYKSSRQTQIGHTQPSLISSHLSGRNPECHQHLARTMAMANFMFNESPECFKVCEGSFSPTMEKFSFEFRQSFQLDNEGTDEKCKKYLNHLASTVFPNCHIKLHLDTKNDKFAGYAGVVVVNLCIPRNKNFPMSPQFSNWLDSLGYTEYFPLCIVNYSRKVCRDACLRPDMQVVLMADKTSPFYNIRKAVADALLDTESNTSYLNTFDRMQGISFNEVMTSIREFNRKQSALLRKIKNGQAVSIYRGCYKTMGRSLLLEVKDCANVLKRSPSNDLQYDWISDTSNGGGLKVPIIPDPSSTYQGPIIAMTASYDVMVRTHVIYVMQSNWTEF